MENNKNKQVMIFDHHGNHDGASTSRPKYPPGYRFMPTDRELILEYLEKKVRNEPIRVKEISVVNLYEHPPEYLAANYPHLGNKEWYIFTPRDRKYPKGYRPSRSVEDLGYWKATGADTNIFSADGAVVGFRKTLVYHIFEGEPSDRQKIKTDWNMHEYRLNVPPRRPNSKDMKLDDWVLCRIYGKGGGKRYTKQTEKRYKKYKKQTDAQACVAIEDGAQPFVQNNGIADAQACVAIQDGAQPFVQNNGMAAQAEPLNIREALNIQGDNNHCNSHITKHYLGPCPSVDNNNLCNAGSIRQNHVDHGQYASNFGYSAGHQYSTSNYYPGQAPLPDMSSHFQNSNLPEDIILPLPYMNDFLSLSDNDLFEFEDYLIDFPCLAEEAGSSSRMRSGLMEFDDYTTDHPMLADQEEGSSSRTKSSDGTDDQHMRLKRRRNFDTDDQQ